MKKHLDKGTSIKFGKYQIKKYWNIISGIDVFLLEINENIEATNLSLIPQAQKTDIDKYHKYIDRNKRLVARSFLFEYCKHHYDLNDFDFIFNEYLQPSFKNSRIRFSFSYSRQYILIGISETKQIGVDIEHNNKEISCDGIAPLIMHDKEIFTFKSIPHQNEQYKSDYFYTLWSGKESLIKAWGKGFHHLTTTINVMEEKPYFSHESKNYTCLGLQNIDDFSLAVSYENDL